MVPFLLPSLPLGPALPLQALALRYSKLDGWREIVRLTIDPKTGRFEKAFSVGRLDPYPDNTYNLLPDSQGRRIAYTFGTRGDQSVKIFDVRTRRSWRVPKTQWTHFVEWSPKADSLAIFTQAPEPTMRWLNAEKGTELARSEGVGAARFLPSGNGLVGTLEPERGSRTWITFRLVRRGTADQELDESATDRLLGPTWRRAVHAFKGEAESKFDQARGSVFLSPSGRRSFQPMGVTGDRWLENEDGTPPTESSYVAGIHHFQFLKDDLNMANLSGYAMLVLPLGWSRDERFLYARKSGDLVRIDADTGISYPIRSLDSRFSVFWMGEGR